MNKSFNTIKPKISLKLFLLSLLIVIFSQIELSAQDLIRDILKKVDAVNQQLLNITAVSDEEENKIGEELDKKIMKELKTGKERKFDVKKIFEKIKTHLERKKINYSYSIIENKDVNAFAIAGGKIYLLTGLLDHLESEDEIAFVIAHEFAHIELKHCINRVQYSAIASKIDPTLGDIVQAAYLIYTMPFSQQQEYEADDKGAELMLKAGYKIDGAVSFFDKLEKLEKKYGIEKRDELNDFISSHPTAKDRKERIKKRK